MDRSTSRLPDPAEQLPYGERRRAVRQKLHTPVYVSFNTPQSGAVVDLSELLDLHENGFAVQTALPTSLRNTDLHNSNLPNTNLQNTDVHKNDRLEVNRAVTMCLDLPETRKFVHASGQVMWTDDTGRAGIRFSFLPDASRQVLKEWLFANLLVASTNYSARTNQLAHQRDLRATEIAATKGSTAHDSRAEDSTAEILPYALKLELTSIHTPPAAPESDATDSGRAQLLSALDDVRRQIRALDAGAVEGDTRAHSDAVLQLITEQAVSLTRASGAALALLTGDKIVCRASVGEPALPVGSEVDTGSGLSGECLRNGTIVSCTDTEADARVDPEVCRMFGIGSFMAVPIFADSRIIGLVEIFSPYPHTFTELHEIVLERLAELVPGAESERIENASIGNEQIEQKKIEAREVENNNGAVVRTEIAAPAQTAGTEREEIETEPARARQTAAERNAILEQIFERTSERTSERTPERASQRTSAQTSQRTPDQTSDQISEQGSSRSSGEDSETVAESNPSSARRHPFSHLVLFLLTIAVAMLALGYLLAPTIEEHLLRRAEAAPTSVAASSPQSAADHQRHALSPAELRQSAERGDPDAEWQLGIRYHDGDGIPQDDVLAMQWFERAAEQGYVPAQATLGAYYWAGRGVPQDRSKAYFWSLLALAQGDKDSKSRLEGLSAEMTRAQVAAARQQAEAWLQAHNQNANPKSN